MSLLQEIKEASAYIKSQISTTPNIGLILGSGLGDLANEITDAVKIPYGKIPHFPTSTVAGHAGQLVIGQLEGKTVVAMQGRFHYYEGYTMQQLTFPVRVMKAIGVEMMIVTNACGGLYDKLEPGSLMLITDHINFIGDNPLIGTNYPELGPRFPDMSAAYSKNLIALAASVAADQGLDVKKGIYTAVSGPNYCSIAELKMIKTLGSDTIGMSTIPETIVAVHSGIEVLGISCITDNANPDRELVPLEHAHVVETANKARPKFINLVKGILRKVEVLENKATAN